MQQHRARVRSTLTPPPNPKPPPQPYLLRFDVNRADKHIIQSIAILDTLDKDINTFAMRVREWNAQAG